MKIPKSFSILGHEVKILFSDTRMKDKNALGYLEPSMLRIHLAKTEDGEKLPTSIIEHTYLHEVVHKILQEMGELELYRNEKFVDLFAGLLHQVLTTSKY